LDAINSPYLNSLPRRTLHRLCPWLVMVLLLAFTSLAKAQTTAPEPEVQTDNIVTGQVVAVKFQGNHALSSDELATVTTTKVTGGMSRLIHGVIKSLGSDYQSLSPTSLDRDTAALDQYYQDHGFIDARSTYQWHANRDDLHNYYEQIRRERLTQSPDTKGAPLPQIGDTVIFTIHEGAPYTISRVAVEGLESLPNEFQTELNDKVTIKTGERWSRAAAATEVQRLTNILIENGYPNPHSDSIVVQHKDGVHTVNILFYFRPGHRYRYGPVKIIFDTTSGEKSRVEDKIILAQLYIDSGHWYKLSEIQRSEAALSKLGVFDLFRISLDTNYINQLPYTHRDSAAVPIDIFLRMKQRVEVPLGIFAGESSQQSLVFGITLGLTVNNLTQTADNFNFQASAQPLPTSLQRYSGNIDYILHALPGIDLGRIPLVAGLGYSHQVQTIPPATDTFVLYSAHLGSNITLSKADNKTTLIPDLLVAYVNTETHDSTILATAPPKQVNLIPSIAYQYDGTNDLINPTRGYLFSTAFEWGIPTRLIFSPSSDYLKLVPQVKYYFDLSNNGTAVIATHLRVGATYLMGDSGREPSLDRRFYGGGATSNRGWAEQSLLVSKSATDTALEGGYNDLEFNLEFRYAPFQYPGEFTTWQQFSSPIRLVLFYDLGNVWDNIAWTNPAEAFAPKMMAQTIGWGLRYNTFFGALRIDWGFKLYDPSGLFSGSQKAITPGMNGGWLFGHNLLSIGNTSNIHFGIGQAF
jgi:outer membrane protein assembly factor BamA